MPSAPPLHVHGISTSSEAIKVMFEPPPKWHQNAPIIKYTIFYTRKLSRTPISETVDKDVRQHLLQGLAKFTKYIVWMTVTNEIGESPPSTQFEIYTSGEGLCNTNSH